MDHDNEQIAISWWQIIVAATLILLLFATARLRKIILFLFFLLFIVRYMGPQDSVCKDSLKNVLWLAVNNAENPLAIGIIDYLQKQLKCCGWHSNKDYAEEKVPESCCINDCELQNYYPGCKDIFEKSSF
ncbi:uncharacterized protein ACN427_002282 [Glossina fuscipes fuscipes]|uniref:Tetraspanin n=1 Tax=Glossina palpalis gambiensis TaxID=67801 RepID=A0A1B0C4B7_9MUSC|nr:hypothetical protein GQX74_005210 [Glossina fuscipes]